MTAPINTEEPKPADIELTLALEAALRPHGCFESDEELNHRMDVLSRLNDIVKKWIKETSVAKNMPESLADTVGGKIFTFGSYRLGALISCIHISEMRCNCISLLRTDLGCLSNKYQQHVLHLYDPEGYTWIGLLGTTLA
jgi:poly(A) polymerase Pap1